MGVVTFIALAGLRFFIVPSFFGWSTPNLETIVNSVLDGFIVALVSSATTTVLILLLVPSVKQMPDITVINPGKELKKLLNEDLTDTKEFWYRGHTAKYTRSEVLPKLASKARIDRTTINVYIIILDPDSHGACQLLADLDSNRNPSINTPSRIKYIRKELLATILCAYLWNVKEPFLDISIGLHDKVSLFRVDLTGKSAIVTRSSPQDCAIRYSDHSDFYRSFVEDLRVSFKQAKQLPKNIDQPLDHASLNAVNARSILTELGLNLSGFTEPELAEVVSTALEPRSPY